MPPPTCALLSALAPVDWHNYTGASAGISGKETMRRQLLTFAPLNVNAFACQAHRNAYKYKLLYKSFATSFDNKAKVRLQIFFLIEQVRGDCIRTAPWMQSSAGDQTESKHLSDAIGSGVGSPADNGLYCYGFTIFRFIGTRLNLKIVDSSQ